MPMALMVPVHLDALFLSAPQPVVDWTLPYWHLPHHDASGRVRNGDVAFLASAVERDAFHSAHQLLPPGMHLHWSMPDALTRRRADGSFPLLPNRWALRRVGGTFSDGTSLPTRSWLIESDALRFGPTVEGPASCIYWDGEPPFAWLGVTHDVAPPTPGVVVGFAPHPRVDPFTIALS
jgi:hypothetical protein